MRRSINAWVWARSVGFLSVSLVGGACGSSGSAAGETDAGSSGDQGGSDVSGGDPGEACEVAPGRVGVQRLTRAEYNRTVRDLFGVTSAPADAFPRTPRRAASTITRRASPSARSWPSFSSTLPRRWRPRR